MKLSYIQASILSSILAICNYTYHAFLDFLEPNYSIDIQ